MKGGNFYRVRAKQLSLALVAIVCISILSWGWGKTQLVGTLLPPQERLNVLPSVILEESPVVTQVTYTSPQPYKEEDFSDATTVRGPTNGETEPVSGVGPTSSTSTDSLENQEEDEDSTTMTLEKKGSTTISSPENRKEDEDSTTVIMEKGSTTTSSSKSREEEDDPTTVTVGKKGSTTISSPENWKEDKDLTTVTLEKKECNYGRGKWVEDDRRPLYSGFGCKQWLSEMWACRLTQRTDFSYERFRWQPESCEMPEFDGPSFLRRMKDKTIALVGDSLGRQQFQSLMCMVTGGKVSPKVKDVGREYGLFKRRGATRPDGWAYRFMSTNTTILYYWSASLCEIEPLDISDPATNYAMHLDRPATFLKQYLHRFDILVLNTGHHWNRGKLTANRWEMYVGGMPNSNRKLAMIGSAKNFTVYSVVKWLDSQLPQHPHLKAFFRTISPRHFVNGDWNTGGNCDNTRPLSRGSQVFQNSSIDALSDGAVKGTQVKLLDITALSQLRDEGHISRYSAKSTNGVHDCLHWCLPGIPDTWNEILTAQI